MLRGTTSCLRFLLLVACASASAGCGGDDKRPTAPVTGAVLLDGKPLESGSIVFDPADGQGSPASAAIEQGKFSGQVEPGSKIVRISATVTTGEKDQYGEPVSKSLVPDRYNGTSKLKADVKADGPNELPPFELKSK